MKSKLLITLLSACASFDSSAQIGGWSSCITPGLSRVNDIFVADGVAIYAACGSNGKVIRSFDEGFTWQIVLHDDSILYRSVEFTNYQKGFIGGFPIDNGTTNILKKTINAGATWTDLTPLLDIRARGGICGLSVPDSNTVYGCGNWYQDSAYIVKSINGGNTWTFIDMHSYATHLIDIYFLNKDTGFVTGSGLLPLRTAVILYTTDGGQTWTYKFQNTISNEYCWKIQHLQDQIYFASIEDLTNVPSQILKSIDGGMTWNIHIVSPMNENIQGVGFINPLKGWAGGSHNIPTRTFESNDGGITWDTINICRAMNRIFRVNDSLLFAAGLEIWKYNSISTAIEHPALQGISYASLHCYPNPANRNLNISVNIRRATRALVILFDETGKRIKTIDNSDKPVGDYNYQISTEFLKQGVYYVVLKTHEDNQTVKVLVER